MIFWLAVAALAAVITFLITRPLARTPESSVDEQSADVAVYRDQLAEIASDLQRGSISATEAEAARTEISRRLLRVDGSGVGAAAEEGMRNTAPNTALPVTPRVLHGTLSILLPLASLALYLGFGEPGMPAQPLASRMQSPLTESSAAELVARVENQLRQNPKDGRGWEVVAPVYKAQQRFADAANAYRNAIRYLGETVPRLKGYADVRIREENGIIPDDAKTAYEKILQAEPDNVEAKFWLAAAKEQNGERTAAADAYRKLLADAPADAYWRDMVEARLRFVTQEDSTSSDASDGDASAPALSLSDQSRIHQMVSGLEKRLADNPDDLKGWLMLIRSYHVLGQIPKARTSLQSAKRAFATNAEATTKLEQIGVELKLGSHG